MFYPLLKVGYWKPLLLFVAIYFSHQFCEYLLHIFGCYDVEYMFIYNYYTFLVNWSFSHVYNVFLFVSFDSDSKSILSDTSMATFVSFWFLVLLPSSYQMHWAPDWLSPNLSMHRTHVHQLATGEGHSFSVFVLSLLCKAGEDNLTVWVLCPKIKMSYFNLKSY